MVQAKAKNTLTKSLPSYKNPPVNEVVCGMRFQTPEKLRIPHIGLLWEKFREEYPNIQHASPIISVPGQIIEDKTTGFPLPRVWFINLQDNELIQFQCDRFYYNWRRRNGVYPRYPKVISNFEAAFNKIKDFFKENEFGDFITLELELSYINHIPKGEGWDTVEDLRNLLVDFPWKQRKDRFLPNPYKTTWTSVFQLPNENGHLTLNVKEVTRISDKVPIIILELIARKTCEITNEHREIRKWYDLAREWIVRGFADLTSAKIQKDIWKIENA
jgi:uncharacterized protein (TIGR04255 family)